MFSPLIHEWKNKIVFSQAKMLGSHKSDFILTSALLALINKDVFGYISHYIKYGNALA